MATIKAVLAKRILNETFRAGDFDLYAGLIDDDDAEITGYDGNRKAITFGAPSDVDGRETIASSAAVEFKEMPLCTVKAAGLYDAATGGNLLMVVPLVNDDDEEITVDVTEDQTFALDGGEFVIDVIAEDEEEAE